MGNVRVEESEIRWRAFAFPYFYSLRHNYRVFRRFSSLHSRAFKTLFWTKKRENEKNGL